MLQERLASQQQLITQMMATLAGNMTAEATINQQRNIFNTFHHQVQAPSHSQAPPNPPAGIAPQRPPQYSTPRVFGHEFVQAQASFGDAHMRLPPALTPAEMRDRVGEMTLGELTPRNGYLSSQDAEMKQLLINFYLSLPGKFGKVPTGRGYNPFSSKKSIYEPCPKFFGDPKDYAVWAIQFRCFFHENDASVSNKSMKLSKLVDWGHPSLGKVCIRLDGSMEGYKFALEFLEDTYGGVKRTRLTALGSLEEADTIGTHGINNCKLNAAQSVINEDSESAQDLLATKEDSEMSNDDQMATAAIDGGEPVISDDKFNIGKPEDDLEIGLEIDLDKAVSVSRGGAKNANLMVHVNAAQSVIVDEDSESAQDLLATEEDSETSNNNQMAAAIIGGREAVISDDEFNIDLKIGDGKVIGDGLLNFTAAVSTTKPGAVVPSWEGIIKNHGRVSRQNPRRIVPPFLEASSSLLQIGSWLKNTNILKREEFHRRRDKFHTFFLQCTQSTARASVRDFWRENGFCHLVPVLVIHRICERLWLSTPRRTHRRKLKQI